MEQQLKNWQSALYAVVISALGLGAVYFFGFSNSPDAVAAAAAVAVATTAAVVAVATTAAVVAVAVVVVAVAVAVAVGDCFIIFGGICIGASVALVVWISRDIATQTVSKRALIWFLVLLLRFHKCRMFLSIHNFFEYQFLFEQENKLQSILIL